MVLPSPSGSAEAHALYLLKGLARPLQVEGEVGNDFAQHPDVTLGEVEVAERLGVRGEHALAGPRVEGCRSCPPRWGIRARRDHAEMTFMNEL